jgi:fructose-bisphosphate aldolase class II
MYNRVLEGCKTKELVVGDYVNYLKANAGNVPHTKLMEQGLELVIRQTMQWIQICGSAGKANSSVAVIENGWISANDTR